MSIVNWSVLGPLIAIFGLFSLHRRLGMEADQCKVLLGILTAATHCQGDCTTAHPPRPSREGSILKYMHTIIVLDTSWPWSYSSCSSLSICSRRPFRGRRRTSEYIFCETNPPVNHLLCKYLGLRVPESGRAHPVGRPECFRVGEMICGKTADSQSRPTRGRPRGGRLPRGQLQPSSQRAWPNSDTEARFSHLLSG